MAYQRIYLGHGIGLRPKHYAQFLESRVRVDWVEAISENFMRIGGRPLAVLEKVRRDVPVALHGVSLSIGSTDPLNSQYLLELDELVRRIEPAIVSDHLCWGSHGGRYVHDLLPLPFTEEALEHVVRRVEKVQERLKRKILLENVSSYLTYSESTLSEWDFLSEVAQRADCGILLDINNIYVSAKNHGFDPFDYLDGVPIQRVVQFHLAGHSDCGEYLLDTHDQHVSAEVWNLYCEAVRRFGLVSTLIEWDEKIPELQVLLAESRLAREFEMKSLMKAPIVSARTRSEAR
jgi:uncharacterized protein (UPF0276 family)